MVMATFSSHTGVPETCHTALPVLAQVHGLQDGMAQCSTFTLRRERPSTSEFTPKFACFQGQQCNCI